MDIEREINIAEFKRYLLGDLPPAETETIDLQIISDEGFEEKLFWAESELMEDYLDETLSTAEIKLFKKNFLVSNERLAQFEQISLLRNYAQNLTAKKAPAHETAELTEDWLNKFKRFIFLNWRPTAAAFALVLVGLTAVFYLTANYQSPAEREFAALNQKDLSDLTELKPLASLSLMKGVFRDSDGVRRLPEDRLTEKVLLRLALPMPTAAPQKFRAELSKDGKNLFKLDKLPFYNNPNGQEIRLLLPSTVLKKGTYQIKIAAEDAPESAFIYGFAIE